MKATINAEYVPEHLEALKINWNGYTFFVLFGKYFNGWFVSIPNWNVSGEIADPEDIDYNSKVLSSALSNEYMGTALAESISEYWKGKGYGSKN